MTTNAPKTLPNSRIHSESGRMPISIMLIGVIIAIGLVKDDKKPFKPPCARNVDTSIRIMLSNANATVTLMSLVGGLMPKPNIPMRLEMPSSNSTVPRYAKYGLPALPMLPSKKLFTHVTADSSIACPRPGTIFRLRVKSRTTIMMNAIMPHMTTMDSCTGIPPNSGMVKATSVCSSSANASPIFSPSSLTSSFAVSAKGICRLGINGSIQSVEC